MYAPPHIDCNCETCESRRRIAELEAENNALREFICHHGGLINEWADEHKIGTLTEYIEHKLDFWLEENDG